MAESYVVFQRHRIEERSGLKDVPMLRSIASLIFRGAMDSRPSINAPEAGVAVRRMSEYSSFSQPLLLDDGNLSRCVR